MYKDVTVEIDGEIVEYEGALDDPTFNGTMGVVFGSTGRAESEDEVVSCVPFGSVAILAIWGTKEDGTYWSIDGLFKQGEWKKTKDGGVLFSVEERIA